MPCTLRAPRPALPCRHKNPSLLYVALRLHRVMRLQEKLTRVLAEDGHEYIIRQID